MIGTVRRVADPRDAEATKGELRRRYRMVRREAAADPGRHAAIRSRLEALGRLSDARVVLSFAAVPGEPDLAELHDRLRSSGIAVLVPESTPSASMPDGIAAIDVVLVPGVAFTAAGDRLGQGGGWFDRLLSGVRSDCLLVGVCFDGQLVTDLPVEPHDVPVHLVVTESMTIDCRST